MNTQIYFERIRGTEREYDTARRALSYCVLAHASQFAPNLRSATNPVDAARCLSNLEPTYVIRMFSVFESALRDYWLYRRGRKSIPDMKPLINAIATYVNADTATISNAHDVRDYRNDLVHGRKPAGLLTIQECRNRLNAFLSYFEKGEWELKIHPAP